MKFGDGVGIEMGGDWKVNVFIFVDGVGVLNIGSWGLNLIGFDFDEVVMGAFVDLYGFMNEGKEIFECWLLVLELIFCVWLFRELCKFVLKK